jgi:hypothetical protein
LASFNPSRHGFQSRSMARTQKEQGGVGSEREWSAFETVKIEIHTHTRAPRAMLRRSRQTESLRTRQNALSNYTRSGYFPTVSRMVKMFKLAFPQAVTP